ncbi:flagellar FlbD family protein [Virgibacillus sp. YIM 98842]|uniref:flagellar FlbD family protein n=1 Tax=Virgibacillus sp. YIM 98842 TaxID=2663533 RepID=UPI0013DB40A0|nr:flagellar FlbD family protein [Virgibacillus sp. YIM 98842]
MIQLTRLNGEPFTLNALMIEQIQSLPDTTITLTNSKKMVVKESETEVTQLITAYYQKVGLHGNLKGEGKSNE